MSDKVKWVAPSKISLTSTEGLNLNLRFDNTTEAWLMELNRSYRQQGYSAINFSSRETIANPHATVLRWKLGSSSVSLEHVVDCFVSVGAGMGEIAASSLEIQIDEPRLSRLKGAYVLSDLHIANSLSGVIASQLAPLGVSEKFRDRLHVTIAASRRKNPLFRHSPLKPPLRLGVASLRLSAIGQLGTCGRTIVEIPFEHRTI